MTSNIPEKDLEVPFDLYVHAAKKDYEVEIENNEVVNAATNNYITCTTYEHLQKSKKEQKDGNLIYYVKINGENKQFFAKFISGILTSARDLYELGNGFVFEIEAVLLSEEEDKYIRATCKNNDDYLDERSYRLGIARIREFLKIAGSQLTDSICQFAYKLITNVNFARSSTLAGAKMNLADEAKSEDKEVKLVQKLKTAMDNSVYNRSDVYRNVVIGSVIHFMKCMAFIINRYIWHNHRTQSINIPTLVGLLASHGLDASFIKEYTKIQPKKTVAKKVKAPAE